MKASKILTAAERAQVEAAIADAETRTAGELVVCIASRSGRYDRGEDLFGVFTALLTVGVAWTWLQGIVESDWSHSVALGLLGVLALFVGGFVLGVLIATRVPVLGTFFTSHREMEAEVTRCADAAYATLGVSGTRQNTGVLIYISVLERLVRVVGDEAIDAKISQSDWDGMRDQIIEGFKSKNVASGLLAAIAEADALLAKQVPGEHPNPDEIDSSIRFVD